MPFAHTLAREQKMSRGQAAVHGVCVSIGDTVGGHLLEMRMEGWDGMIEIWEHAICHVTGMCVLCKSSLSDIVREFEDA
jgi:hypothetical protein